MKPEEMTPECLSAYEIGRIDGLEEALRGVVVTPLDWVYRQDHDTWVAKGVQGEYKAWRVGETAYWLFPTRENRGTLAGGTIDDAKGRCFAHQDAVIRSFVRLPNASRRGIFVSGSHQLAELWSDLRMFERMPVISSWIDEPGVMETGGRSGVRLRSISEVKTAAAFVIYRRPGEGTDIVSLDELKAALDNDVPVFAVGLAAMPEGADPRIRHCENLIEARRLAGILAPSLPAAA